MHCYFQKTFNQLLQSTKCTKKEKNHRLKFLKEKIDLYYIMLEKHMWQKGQGYTWIYIKNHLSLDLDFEF
jgi:hypothetical protein